MKQASIELEEIATALAAELGEHVAIPGILSDEKLTSDVSPGLFGFYIMASQFAHGTLMTTAFLPNKADDDRPIDWTKSTQA